MFYHLQIENKSTDEYKMDLSENNLISDIIQPYEKGHPITINGETFHSNDMKIKISKTNESYSQIKPSLEHVDPFGLRSTYPFSESEAKYHVFTNGENVTDDFIKGHPGYKKFSTALSKDIDTFWVIIHPQITTISKKKFEDGHFADSVESALKEVNTRVKKYFKASQGKEPDGADLMHNAFSPKNPIIIIDDLSTESGRAMQQGYMELFAGSMTGIRNPKAHENITITSERAIHFLFLSSLLMSKLDEAGIPE